jgi:hypothetical protein
VVICGGKNTPTFENNSVEKSGWAKSAREGMSR